MEYKNQNIDYRDLSLYIVKNLYNLLKDGVGSFINPYSLEKQILNEFTLKFSSLSEEQIYSFCYRLLMDIEKKFDYDVGIRFELIKDNLLNKRNLFIFVEYILKILEEDKESFKNECIKLDILILLLYLSKNNCEELVLAYGYFNICINELQKIYPNIECPKKTIFDQEIINKYNGEKRRNFAASLKEVEIYYNKNKIFGELPKINKLLNQINSKEININNIDSFINAYNKYLDRFLKEKFNYSSFKTDKKERKEDEENDEDIEEIKLNEESLEIKRILFELTDINEMICYLSIKGLYINILKNYKEKYEPIFVSKTKEEDLTNDLKSIIQSDEFEDKLKNILESKVIQEYLNKKRRFSDVTNKELKEFYEFSFIDEIKPKNDSSNNSNDDLDDLKKEFNTFMEYYKNKKWFEKIIIFKYLPNGFRAFVNQTMLIAVNPLFIKQSNLLKNNFDKKRKILFSYLIILFIHEIIHILKFMKKKKFKELNELPLTPKSKEGGKILINYLFGKPVIKKINEEQAEKILDINNWNNLDNLKNIFSAENEEKNEDKDMKDISISFYSTNLKEEKVERIYNKDEHTRY